MKIAVFSDIHGNYTAWKKAFSIMQAKNIDKYLCAGDLVGYGPRPNEVINHIKEQQETGLDITIVPGNHDYGVINEQSLKRFNSHAKQAIRWTRKELNATNKQFLEELPLSWSNEEILLAHGTPNNPIWQYLKGWNVNHIFAEYDFKYCFVGHTHLLQSFIAPLDSAEAKKTELSTNQSLTLESQQRVVINDGSIGQPRDHNPQGSFIILDTSKNKIDVIRFQYNINQTQQLIYDSDLPNLEGERLAEGR
ncbi:metallophosphoesterase family protein [Halanaerobacter jeridensis]|uniref:Phosphodiesterase n=1 Tax=Halanaerobacter jeridensis TaxID=706427 RepID=A0A939BM83_9FIRM|nr:metallophosphoesterase family protein [Halanaerobacter jeridensis]MBM7555800.1 putative phosphodiesterase [Halanaerobacter jeridensis]